MKNVLQRLEMWNVQPQLLMVSDWVAGGFRVPALPQCGFQNNIGSQKISPFVFFIQTRFKIYIKKWNCNVRMFITGFGPERSLGHTQHFWHNQKEEQEERDLQKTLCFLIVLAHQETYPNELLLVSRQRFFRYARQTSGICVTGECVRNTNSQALLQAYWIRNSRDEAQQRCLVTGPPGDFATHYFLGSKIIADGDFSHEIKRRLLLGRKVMTNLDSILKSRDITLSTKVHLVKAMVFPVVMYGCERCTIKRAECRRIDAFELWCWRRLLRVPWIARRSEQSILKEISPEYSLEGLMLKLKFQYFVHLMGTTD